VIEFADGVCDDRRFGLLKNFVLFPSVDSTNSLGSGLLEYLAEEEVDLGPTVIAALEQTGGRGRRDRSWSSPQGGLYVTFVFRAPSGVPLEIWPIAAGVWTAETLRETAGVPVELKWPNDLLCRGRKVGGILTEARSRGDETRIVLGVGANVIGTAADYGGDPATTIEEQTGLRPSIASLFDGLCERFARFLDAPSASTAVRRWEELTVHRSGDRISVRSGPDEQPETIEGRFVGVTETGLLRLLTESGEERLAAGEVDLR
jgi:BirA family biotin operon repressor/biotin-[acetyl-CoA-carboxylase] ligase